MSQTPETPDEVGTEAVAEVVPAGTPKEVIGKLNTALLAAMDTTAVKARLQTLGLESTPSSPEAMAKYASDERAKWGQVIKNSGIKLD